MCVMCPLVQHYSVITLDNWHSAYCGPTRSKNLKTDDCECWFIQQFASIACVHSHLLFSYLRLYLFRVNLTKLYLDNGEDPDQLC